MKKNLVAMAWIALSLASAFGGALAQADESQPGKYVVEITIKENGKLVGGTIVPQYNRPADDAINAKIPFDKNGGDIDLFPAANIAIERLDVLDEQGRRVAYCNDGQLYGLAQNIMLDSSVEKVQLEIDTPNGNFPVGRVLNGRKIGGCDAFKF